MHFMTAVAWIFGSLMAIYLLFAELLDTIGRLEIIEKRWPRLWRAMNNRPFRLILLLFLIVLVAKDLSERAQERQPPILHVVMPAPPAPVVQMVQPPNHARPEPRISVKQGPCGVSQIGGSHNQASVDCTPPQRILTPEQKQKLRSSLEKAGVFTYGLRHSDGNLESQKFADQFDDVLQSAHWQPRQTQFLIASKETIGIWVLVPDKLNPPVGATALLNALKEAGIGASGFEVPPLHAGTFDLVVGLQDTSIPK